MINRIYDDLKKYLKPNRVLVIFGPRRVGKTTLLNNLVKNTKLKCLFLTGDNTKVQEIIGSGNLEIIKEYLANYELLVIDEAQYIPNIGMSLKLIVDNIKNFYVLVTGSASFDLGNQVGEPLTGRKLTLTLFPISQLELKEGLNNFELKEKLEDVLIFGAYPQSITAKSMDEKRLILEEISSSYLLKDILAFDKIKNSKTIMDLLRLLAFQIGNEVSLNELGSQLNIDKNTVNRYLDLLEKSFILVNLRGYSRNLRKEVSKKSKYYFYDTGIRNAIISNFNKLDLRNDVGQLWENFLVIERVKKQKYKKIYANNYFWRTWDGQEIDWVEEREGKVFGYEFKWNKKDIKTPIDWQNTYNNASFEVINRDNYLDFVG